LAILPPTERYADGLDAGVDDLRVTVTPDLGHATVDPELASAVEAAAERFAEPGARVELVATTRRL
jgi:aspartyl-tRNA(Asn)/glutamyl-tRNA(Gln) amidotransferase subunit A